ncbi:MAG TPA: hypothetical protein VFU22_08000 [Roseiflexaceae bacterium]|nr:hypothetical protein [Roseiflexaceae bacterium]
MPERLNFGIGRGQDGDDLMGRLGGANREQPSALPNGGAITTGARLASAVGGAGAPNLSTAVRASAPSLVNRSGILDKILIDPSLKIRPELLDLFDPRFAGQQTMTKLAQSAINTLNQSDSGNLQRAFNSIAGKSQAIRDETGKNGPDGGLVEYLHQKTKFTEVLAEFARGWTVPTKNGFATAFAMDAQDANQLPVMDNIVAIAILNDPDLEAQLRRENTSQPSGADLIENRRIVWQHPAPGTVLQPPYLVLVAVEYVDTSTAQDIVQQIMGDLVAYQGYKIPSAAMQKLR